jgi:ADP-ribose pyrophosphatase
MDTSLDKDTKTESRQRAADKTVFQTPWFRLVARATTPDADPHYVIFATDYAVVVALTARREFVLVRQWRPAVDAHTLELPSGHVDSGQTPEDAARAELLEETGYVAGKMTLLGCLQPDPGRLGNMMWCYFAPDVERSSSANGEQGIETVLFSRPLRELLATEDFASALNRGTLLLAIERGLLKLD